jgi:hypothetical protein
VDSTELDRFSTEPPESCINLARSPLWDIRVLQGVMMTRVARWMIIASTGAIEGYFGVWLASLILFHHYDPFRTDWLWFRCIPTISMILSILSYRLIKFTEEVILGTILGGTSQCNSSLESGGTTLQDRMMRSDFQWPGKPQGEIRCFSEVKRLIN